MNESIKLAIKVIGAILLALLIVGTTAGFSWILGLALAETFAK